MQNKGGRAFLIYLAGQGISNFGDSFRFIAVTMLIFKLTGSGITAALGLALSTLPSIIASPFAGVLGDRIDERLLLVLLDFVRVLAVPLFLYMDNILQVYMLLILLSLFDVFYGPSRRKFILGMTGRKGALNANSLLTGVSGAAYLTGPLTAGFLIDSYGSAPAILIASLCFFASCLMTFFAGIVYGREANAISVKKVGSSYFNTGERLYRRVTHKVPVLSRDNPMSEFQEGLRYCLATPNVRTLLVIGLVTGFSTISVNLAFYPYAFDVLKVTAKGWSLMITVYYGTNLIAMLLVKYLDRIFRGREGRLFYTGLTIVSIIWALYAFVTKFENVLLLQFIEGSVIAVCGIILAARFQVITDRWFMARVSGMNDIFSNMGKLAGMGCAVVLTGSFSFGAVFIFNSAILFLFAFSGLISSKWS